ncbi:monovalent cation/H(+) antiporter subunit G [Methylosinus sp. KRF6]|uniref:monovalent cation/H(+) antiporter subunit G n=1 Tax=Methylosinus sp. KRF6 TaxID=2846853 RepID=UPI001C0CFA2E|nr:monovalent cation/H(+) antiporter subunit G [Methylosinus sp. KRF6]MBU3888518.1 monovalent cation/H(+) antiporter subunit G [Methylosinus sp. KRF6]
MAMIADAATLTLAAAGVVFFIAGTLGLLRFPDALTRLHALTKADNLGLGLIVIGLIPQTGGVWMASKLLLVWLLNNLAAATIAQLFARIALTTGRELARSEE